MATTQERTITVIDGWSPHPTGHATESHTLRGDLEMDSMDIVELSMELEDEFGIEIDGKSWSKMQDPGITVRDVIDFITPRVTK